MKRMLSALIAISLLLALAIPANAASPDKADKNMVRVYKLVVEPNGPDLNYTVYYNTTLFTKVFSLFFGAKVVQPSVQNFFTDSNNTTLISIDPSKGIAKFTMKNQSRLTNGGWYVYDGNETFADKVDRIEVKHVSMMKPLVVKNSDHLPQFYYRA
jgi:hypothetical protein